MNFYRCLLCRTISSCSYSFGWPINRIATPLYTNLFIFPAVNVPDFAILWTWPHGGGFSNLQQYQLQWSTIQNRDNSILCGFDLKSCLLKCWAGNDITMHHIEPLIQSGTLHRVKIIGLVSHVERAARRSNHKDAQRRYGSHHVICRKQGRPARISTSQYCARAFDATPSEVNLWELFKNRLHWECKVISRLTLFIISAWEELYQRILSK